MRRGLAILFAVYTLLGRAMAQVPADSLMPDTLGADTSAQSEAPVGGKIKGNIVTKGEVMVVTEPDSNAKDSATSKAKKPIRLDVPVFFWPKRKDEPYNPGVAWKRSVLLPGWGQIYCRRYWKPPIIWAGFAGIAYLLNNSYTQYQHFRYWHYCALNASNDSFPVTPSTAMIEAGFDASEEGQYLQQRDRFRRNIDRLVILGALWYTLNIVDAYVDAHLRDFNVTDDLSLNFRPALHLGPDGRSLIWSAGIGMQFHHRKR